MGRSPCCDKVGLKKGPWTPEEDQKLLAYIEEHGHGSWRALPTKAGLQRCGKSCRLRWTNYLRPDIKRGKFSLQEEQTIIQLHALLGNRWSAIATHLPKRTDNEIKNYWNTHLKKRLAKMGIDPVTHKPKNDALLSAVDGQSKNASNLSHMAQWESARLEAEARLVRESKLRSHHNNSLLHHHHNLQLITNPPNYVVSLPNSSAVAAAPPSTSSAPVVPPVRSNLDVLKAWNSNNQAAGNGGHGLDLESPTSTLTTFNNNNTNIAMPGLIEFVGSNSGCSETGNLAKEEGDQQDWKGGAFANFNPGLHDMPMSSMEAAAGAWSTEPDQEGFTNLLLNNSEDQPSLSDGGGDSDNGGGGGSGSGSGSGGGGGSGSDYYEDNKNYWNSILNLVNSSPSDSPMF